MVACRAAKQRLPTALQQRALIWGIPRGGVSAALAFARDGQFMPCDSVENANIIIDDLVDTGETLLRYMQKFTDKVFVALFKKGAHRDMPLLVYGVNEPKNNWLVFPWEASEEKSADDIVTRLLSFIGEDPGREGLKETPARVLKAWREWTSGYNMDVATTLKTFGDGAERVDELVIVKDIPFYSHCEHHLAPFFGVAHVAYLPAGRIVGLSKIPRLVEVFARRLQVQERLTNQIADALQEHIKPKGIGVILECRHLCMESRGINKPGSTTVTSAMRGALMTKPAARAELLSLIRTR